jgi:muramoyltetrapeptide carboxypeptidase
MSKAAPPLLKPGGTIGVMAPSSIVKREDIEKSKAVLEGRGYTVFVHPQTFEQHHQSAGNVLQKSLALQGLWQRPDIDVIWAAGGGNRGLMLLETINFEKMKGQNKTLIGFSDTTPLLNAISHHIDITTVHATVFRDLHNHKDLDSTLKLLNGDIREYNLDTASILQIGQAEGKLYGGCLSLFHLLAGTDDCPDLGGAILFLEDASDHISRFDRMFCDLRRKGVFEKISGLILGEFHDLQDNKNSFGFSLEDIVLEHTGDFEGPIVMNAPFGHGKNNTPLPIGQRSRLMAATETILEFI